MHTKSCLVRLGFLFLGVVLIVLGLVIFEARSITSISNLRGASNSNVHSRVTDEETINSSDGYKIQVSVVSTDSPLPGSASMLQKTLKFIVDEMNGAYHDVEVAKERVTLLPPHNTDDGNNRFSVTRSLSSTMSSLTKFKYPTGAFENVQPLSSDEVFEAITPLEDTLSLDNIDFEGYYYSANDDHSSDDHIDDNEDDDNPYDDDDNDEMPSESIDQDDHKNEEIIGEEDLQKNGDGQGMIFFEVNL